MFVDSVMAFGLYFVSAMVITALFIYLYAVATPYDDFQMIFEEKNSAAAIAYGGALLGFSLPLYSALTSAVSYEDFLIWAGIAAAVQLLFAGLVTRIKGRYSFEKKIRADVLSVGIFMAFLSITIGLINAASMSY